MIYKKEITFKMIEQKDLEGQPVKYSVVIDAQIRHVISHMGLKVLLISILKQSIMTFTLNCVSNSNKMLDKIVKLAIHTKIKFQIELIHDLLLLINSMRYLPLTFLICLNIAQNIMKFTISSYILPDKKLQMELDVTTPKSPNEYPVIIYMTGLSGLTPSFTQSTLIDSLSETGIIHITITKLSTPSPQRASEILGSVLKWINENIQYILNNKVPGVLADLDNRLILMGHSGAGRIVTQFLNNSCSNVKMQILLNPIDGVDFIGAKKSYIITPGKMLPYATPVLVIASQLDNAKKLIQPACAPNNVSNLRFYDAMSGPKWFLNISKYGHVDFYNNQYRDTFALTCAQCNKSCNFNDYRTTIKQAILTFMDAIFQQSSIALDILENGKFRVPTNFKHSYMGYNIKRKGFCERLQKQTIQLQRQQQRLK